MSLESTLEPWAKYVHHALVTGHRLLWQGWLKALIHPTPHTPPTPTLHVARPRFQCMRSCPRPRPLRPPTPPRRPECEEGKCIGDLEPSKTVPSTGCEEGNCIGDLGAAGGRGGGERIGAWETGKATLQNFTHVKWLITTAMACL